jgi:uncharacterized protein (TIGR00725 family)
MIDRLPIIGVMGSHDKDWTELAVPVGRMIADFGYHLLTGAGAGAMTAVAKAFTEVEPRAGLSLGVVPTVDYDGNFVPRERYPNPYIEIPILTPLDKRAVNDSTPYSRNYVNVMTSHALIILPGEHGTQNEVSLALQFHKPMILFGPDAAFSKFPDSPTRVHDIEEVREFLEKATSKLRVDDHL